MTGCHRRVHAVAGYRATGETVEPAFRFLQQLAADLSKEEISFPTFIDATLRVRRALNDPQGDGAQMARAVSAEPMLAARIMQIANSAGAGPPGAAVGDLKAAILRLGNTRVKAVAMSVAMAQLVAAKEMRPFLNRGELIWRHSLDVAAIAYVLARKLTRLNPDEALFCGLVHDIGHFYLLSKVSNYPELVQDPEALDAVLEDWHAPIGHALLGAFDLSDAVLTAVAEHHAPYPANPPRKLVDVISAANLLSRCPNPLHQDTATAAPVSEADPSMLALLEASADELISLVAALRA